jgi:dethiobiotin synthetase
MPWVQAKHFYIACDRRFVLDERVKRSIFFVTGTDTGVGKTMLTCLLTRYLRAAGYGAVALKPLCSGGREDAVAQHSTVTGALTLDEINPWFFRAALSPLIAARREKRRVTLKQVTTHVHRIQERFPIVLVEGAGGLLSPLGETFDARDLIKALRARPIVVCPNRLGAINHVRLVLNTLPKRFSLQTEIVLMMPQHPDAASKTNSQLLGEIFGANRIHVLPWLKPNTQLRGCIQKIMKALAAKLV